MTRRESPRRTHRLPTGAAAYVFEEAALRRRAEDAIVEGLRAAGYREAIVPSADYLAPYLPHLSPQEERELYRFVDRHGDTLALRADFTIALARHLSGRLATDPAGAVPAPAQRVFYRGEVLRGGAREGSGGELYQIGAELVGDASPDADVEIVERCLAALEAAGARRLYLVLSSVGALEQMLGSHARGDGLRELAAAIRDRRLSESRRLASSVSGVFAGRVRRLLEGDLPPDDPGLARLESGKTLRRVADAIGKRNSCRVAVDVAEPASRSYYTGFFFSVYGEAGGTPIAGGGRYDDLYGAFGAPRPAVGFAVGVEAVVGEAR